MTPPTPGLFNREENDDGIQALSGREPEETAKGAQALLQRQDAEGMELRLQLGLRDLLGLAPLLQVRGHVRPRRGQGNHGRNQMIELYPPQKLAVAKRKGAPRRQKIAGRGFLWNGLD